MTKRNLIIIGVSILLAIFVFTGVFIAVLSSPKNNNSPDNIAYQQIEDLYRNKNFISAKKGLDEMKQKYPNSKLTQKALEEFKDLDKLAQKEEQDKSAKKSHDALIEEMARKQHEEYKQKSAKLEQENQEVWDSYNKVLSKNGYEVMYSGIKMKNQTIIIIVNDYWNRASKDVKHAYVESCVKLWAGMHGARKMAFKYEDWNFEFRHELSDRKLATWDSTWGVSIKD